MNNYQQEFAKLDKAFQYWSDYAFKKASNPVHAGASLDVAPLILQGAYMFPFLSLTITPEWQWEFKADTDMVRHYAFPERNTAVAYLRSIVGKMGFMIEESLKEGIYRKIPLPGHLEHFSGGTADEVGEYFTQWLHYQVRIDQEADRRGIEPINLYGFEIELIYTDRQMNQWLVPIQTQNNMQNGLPFLKMSSKPMFVDRGIG